MRYNAYYIKLEPVMPARELLYALCQDSPVETVQDTDEGAIAFIQFDEDDGSFLESIKNFPIPDVEVSYEIKEFAPTNWNLLWEENFEPINVEDLVRVKASFHESDPSVKHEILIDPKMSFGTGHHQTTWLMLKAMSAVDFKQLNVLDMGCGTGILGIYAAMLGAKSVLGIDIEAWAAENARENAVKNNVEMKVLLGDKDLIEDSYEVILANINRNVLLDQIPLYAKHLKPGGHLFLSGFYNLDLDQIRACAEEAGFKFLLQLEKEDWLVARFTLN